MAAVVKVAKRCVRTPRLRSSTIVDPELRRKAVAWLRPAVWVGERRLRGRVGVRSERGVRVEVRRVRSVSGVARGQLML